jgi:thiol-disulfide isomerase/thioredoxin
MFTFSRVILIFLIFTTFFFTSLAGDTEFVGTFETTLMANTEDMDDVIYKSLAAASKLKFETPPDSNDTTITAARLFHPLQEKNIILSALVEVEDEKPSVYVDINLDGTFSQTELFQMKREKKDNPYLWQATVFIPISGKLFANYPIYIQYFRSYKYDDMNESDRLVRQSKEAYAKGYVDIKGKKTLVMYGFNPTSQKISTSVGWLGVDSDGDGDVYLDRLSPEAAKADSETVIFRAGQTFVSTKKIDLEKNLIIMREHQANDYKRVELKVGEILPDFPFKDFEGKKRKLSDFRGKYVLIDIWGIWCPPCRRELPYLKAAYSKFQPRGLEILGLNTDTDYTIENINSSMKKNGMNWTQAQFESIVSIIKAYRISSFPTTILIDPQGKIVSLSQTDRGQADLRGKDLLKSLDSLLPF